VRRRARETGRCAWWVAASLLVTLLAVAPPARGAEKDDAPEEPTDCFECHDDVVRKDVWENSVHGGEECTVCHPGLDVVPHPDEKEPPDCEACHEDAVKQLAASPHGTAPGPGQKPPVACVDCHGDLHALVPTDDPKSPVHWTNVAGTCAHCHADETIVDRWRIPVAFPVEAYLDSVHAKAVAAGKRAAVCSDCHGAHTTLPASDPASPLARGKVADTCGHCHEKEAAAWRDSVHGTALLRGAIDSPTCTDCHGEHGILGAKDPGSPVSSANLATETCGRCHGSLRLSRKYGLEPGVVTSFADSFHGLALRSGVPTVANCASCHGVHDILPSSDPRSHISPARLPETCGECHPGSGELVALGPVHVVKATASARILGWVRWIYVWLIGIVIGGMVVHNLLDVVRKARRPDGPPPAPPGVRPLRMTRALRWQHGLVMVSFPVLVYTGFALTYPESWWAAPLLAWESKLAIRGLIHRTAGIVLIAALLWHLGHLLVSRELRACFRRIVPGPGDVRELFATLGWYVGLRRTPPHHGTFGYAEKAEYWAFMWGTALMAVTGFILWFENTALRLMPKWVTDLATALHFWEAVLATLAILVWHFYWVIFDPDVYPMDGSWWHGRAPAARDAERTPPDDAPDGH
jgi:cytochrome b subunit of formate dehydrogenase